MLTRILQKDAVKSAEIELSLFKRERTLSRTPHAWLVASTPVKFRRFEDYAHEHGIDAEVLPEEQNSDYESGVATIEGAKWHIRTARNTPTKPGAFVAFWCRDKDGTTAPFKADEVISGLLVFVEQNGQRGVFRFTAEHLEALGITTGKHSGKRGFRVYPSWETNLNKQATATQRAQSPAFQGY